MNFQHEPVLLQEVIQWMNVRDCGVYCDGTLGGGGHSEAILKASGGTASLYGIDRDATAIEAATERLRQYPGFHAIRGNFHDGKALLEEAGAGPLDGVLLDLGVSSPQLDTPERGFSYHENAPLDMRMDRSEGMTAADFLNTADERELTRVIREYGEEKILLTCDQDNEASRRTITKNGGVLENEVAAEASFSKCGVVQRYWITL